MRLKKLSDLPTFKQDVSYFNSLLSKFKWFQTLNIARQCVMLEICSVGWKRLCRMKSLFDYLNQGNYDQAARIISYLFDEKLAQGMKKGIYEFL